MNLTKRLVSVAVSGCLALAALAFSSAPASAAGVGSGLAIIRIDATEAALTKMADGLYTLKVPKGSAGQWLGERTDARGNVRLRVGDVTAKQLSSAWKKFRYTSTGVNTTIAWESEQGTKQMALVRLARPTVTANGIVFRVSSGEQLPSSMQDVTLNLQRAAVKMMRENYNPEAVLSLTGALRFWSGYYDYNQKVDQRLFNDGNDNTCWSHTFVDFPKTVDIPDGRCDDVAHTAGSTSWEYVSPMDTSMTRIMLYTTLQPDGEAAFQYSAQIVSSSTF